MPTIKDTVEFMEALLTRRSALDRRALTTALLQHQLLVRDRFHNADPSSGDELLPDVDLQSSWSGLRIPKDRSGLQLRNILLMDDVVAHVVNRSIDHMLVGQSVAVVAASSTHEALLKACNSVVASIRWVLVIVKLLSATVLREVGVCRHLHFTRGEGHDSACYCITPTGQSALSDALSRTTVKVALAPIVARLITGRATSSRMLREATRLAVESWWKEEVDAVRWMHVVRELQLHVLQPLGEASHITEWMVWSLKPLLVIPDGVGSSRHLLREFVVSTHRKLSTLALGLDSHQGRPEFFSWTSAATQQALRRLIADAVVFPLRPLVSSLVQSAVANGDVASVESAAFLESISTTGRCLSHSAMTSWFEEQIRCALSISLHELVGTALGLDTAALDCPSWSQSAIESHGRKVGEISETFCRCVLSIAEWIEQKTTVMMYVYASNAERVTEAAARTHMQRIMGDAGRRLFKSAGHFLATMIHATLASRKDSDRAMPVVQASCAWVADKDAFLVQMSHCLEVRLLEAMPITEEVVERERSVILTLKNNILNCGIQLRKMEGMLHDAEQQRAIAEAIMLDSSMDYQLGDVRSANFDISLCILMWNMWNTVSCRRLLRTLPQDVRFAMRVIEDAHRARWPSKKLTWAHASSRCTMTLLYTRQQGKRPAVELTLSLVGASILCMFDTLGSDQVDQEELKELVLLRDEEEDGEQSPSTEAGGGRMPTERATTEGERYFKAALKSLLHMKVLHERTDDVKTVVSLNRTFAPTARKISSMTRSQLSALADSQHAGRQLAEDSLAKTRFLALKAAIVRIMKTQREYSHGDLFDATVRQLDKLFLPTTQRFKEVVSELIDAEYIARKEGSSGVYIYLT